MRDAKTDFELVTAIQNNADQSAMDELFDRNYPRLVRALDHNKPRCPEPEEAAADSLMQVWKKKFDALKTTHIYSSLFRMAKNRCIDQFRRKRRETAFSQHGDGDDQQGFDINLIPPANDADLESNRDVLFALQEAIAALPAENQLLVKLRFYEGFTITEIAERLNCSAGHASRRLHQVMDKLRAHLEQDASV